MEIVTLTKDNLEQEHICCAMASNNDCQVRAKKSWLSERLDDGLVFKKGNVRGKCFIEYMPAEKAWCPIDAEGYMFINCLWVSGQYKGQGNSSLLLEECIKDSKEKRKNGLVILSSSKKRPYLAESNYLKHNGFEVVDSADPYFELLYLPFDSQQQKPAFKNSVKTAQVDQQGFVLFYTHQCPFTAKYVPTIKNLAKTKGISFTCIRFESTEQAQNAPSPFTAYSLFYNKEFVTHEILSEKKFEKLLMEKGL
ncbi:MAG: YoaP domain-containing protein [Turicibacter sp.]